jgi:hypothetical protein
VVSAIALALIFNREGLLCFDSSWLSKHRSRRPHRAQD